MTRDVVNLTTMSMVMDLTATLVAACITFFDHTCTVSCVTLGSVHLGRNVGLLVILNGSFGLKCVQTFGQTVTNFSAFSEFVVCFAAMLEVQFGTLTTFVLLGIMLFESFLDESFVLSNISAFSVVLGFTAFFHLQNNKNNASAATVCAEIILQPILFIEDWLVVVVSQGSK